MYKLGSLSKVVLGALTLTLSTSLWANSDVSANHVDKQQQIKEFKQNSVAYVATRFNSRSRNKAAADYKKRSGNVGNSNSSTSSHPDRS